MYHFMKSGISYSDTIAPVCTDGSLAPCAVIQDEKLPLPLDKSADTNGTAFGNKKVFWNFADDGTDFCRALWDVLNAGGSSKKSALRPEPQNCETLIPQLMRIFKKLENIGYITSYTIRSQTGLSKESTKSDGSIDCALVDASFLKNTLVTEQIGILLRTDAETLEASPYFLTDPSGKQFLSAKPGEFGGHNTLKIYGRLECPSAARYLAKGQYAQHRVFFENESAAKAALYRPCARCMPAEYKLWKASQDDLSGGKRK